LATSDPEPIAIPIFAFLIAGESFTPSPVTATILPNCYNPLTINNFCEGEVLAKTTYYILSQLTRNIPFYGSFIGFKSSKILYFANLSP